MMSRRERAHQLSQHFLAWRWIKVSLVVGTLLNLINQFSAILGPASIDWPRLILTYFVPYGVASVSAWSALQNAPSCNCCHASETVSAD